MMSESLELWTCVVSTMLDIVTFTDVATAAGAESFFSRLRGCIATVAELEEVPLVFNDGIPEFGAEYPVGSEENKLICVVVISDLAPASDRSSLALAGRSWYQSNTVSSPGLRLITCRRVNVG